MCKAVVCTTFWLIIAIHLSTLSASGQLCQGIRFEGEMKIGYRLTDRVMLVVHRNTRSLLDCISRCAHNPGCVSVNFEHATRDCELNDRGRAVRVLQLDGGITYYGLKRKSSTVI